MIRNLEFSPIDKETRKKGEKRNLQTNNAHSKYIRIGRNLTFRVTWDLQTTPSAAYCSVSHQLVVKVRFAVIDKVQNNAMCTSTFYFST